MPYAPKMTKKTIDKMVKDLVSSVNDDKRPTRLDRLYQFLVSFNGCNGLVTIDMVQRMTPQQILDQVENDHLHERPPSTIVFTKLKDNEFEEVMEAFLGNLRKEALYDHDGFFLPLLEFLKTMINYDVTVVRVAGVRFLMKFSTELCKIARKVYDRRNVGKRQYATELEKPHAIRSLEMMNGIQETFSELTFEWRNLNQMLLSAVRKMEKDLMRDSDADVVTIFFTEFGKMMVIMPEIFCTNSDLRRLALFLHYEGIKKHQKFAFVRLACVNTLQHLYEAFPDNSQLKSFTSEYKVRLLYVPRDENTKVAIAGVNLLTTILSCKGFLADDDYQTLFPLMLDNNRDLAESIGKLLSSALYFKMSDFDVLSDVCKNICKYKISEYAPYIVICLQDHCSAFKQWNVMTELLLHGEMYDEKLESALIEIMVSCVKRAVEIQHNSNTFKTRNEIVVKQMSSYFVEHLPEILSRYDANERLFLRLLVIAHKINVDIYTQERGEKNARDLLIVLETVFEKHNAIKVLNDIVDVYLHFISSSNLLLQTRARTSLTKFPRYYEKLLSEHFNDTQGSRNLFELSPEMHLIFAKLYTLFRFKELDVYDETIIEFSLEYLENCETRSESMLEKDQFVFGFFSAATANKCRILVEKPNPNEEEVEYVEFLINRFLKLCSNALGGQQKALQLMGFKVMCAFNLLMGYEIRANIPAKLGIYYRKLKERKNVHLKLIEILEENVFERSFSEDPFAMLDDHHQRCILLGLFGKLLRIGFFDVSCVSFLVKHIIHQDLAVCVDAILDLAKIIDRAKFFETLLSSLTKMYTAALPSNGESMDTDSIKKIISVARKLVKFFDNHDDDKAEFHQNGIKFALEPFTRQKDVQNVLFFDVLTVFSAVLPRSAKTEMGKKLGAYKLKEETVKTIAFVPMKRYTKSITNKRSRS